MNLTVLGSGSAFTLKNYQTNFLLSAELQGVKTNFLLDCGSDIRFALKDAGYSYKDIDYVYISHLHADHCGGLEYLAFCRYFDPALRPTLLGPVGAMEKRKPILVGQSKLLQDLWNQTLRGGLSSVEDKEMEMLDYFDLWPLHVNEPVSIPVLGRFAIVQTVHIMNGYSIVPTFGLMVEPEGSTNKVYFTTDTQFNPDQIIKFYRKADIVVQDCEVAKFESKVHAHYNKLKTLPDDVRAKMYLVHYQDTDLPDAIGDGFKGFLKKGEVVTL